MLCHCEISCAWILGTTFLKSIIDQFQALQTMTEPARLCRMKMILVDFFCHANSVDTIRTIQSKFALM